MEKKESFDLFDFPREEKINEEQNENSNIKKRKLDENEEQDEENEEHQDEEYEEYQDEEYEEYQNEEYENEIYQESQQDSSLVLSFEEILKKNQMNFISGGLITPSNLKEENEDLSQWKSKEIVNGIAEWERYTTGIGSKLLKLMGYQIGFGLGKENQGIAAPIGINNQPSNVKNGLGFVKEKKTKRKRRKISQTSTSEIKSSSSKNVFALLDNLLGNKSPTKQTSLQLKSMSKEALQSASSTTFSNLQTLNHKIQEVEKRLQLKHSDQVSLFYPS